MVQAGFELHEVHLFGAYGGKLTELDWTSPTFVDTTVPDLATRQVAAALR
jgi:hypothetical protein